MIVELFTTFIYQPFLNLLVALYWLLGLVTGGNPDMGIAVIILTIILRFLLLPLSIAGDRSEKERRELAKKVKEIESAYASDPIQMEKRKKKVLRANSRILISELFNLSIQVSIALMLWKMFQTGLAGDDVDLVYPFMPDVQLPFNLVFLGKYDLSHTSFTLNIIQSILIFFLETLSTYTSPYHISRKEVIRLQLVLPVVSFLVFMALPAGKKLFVITTLSFSIILTIIKIIYRQFKSYQEQQDEKELSDDSGMSEKIVVETK
jgi:YidC/Oxa1 family membrane protein insertase